MNTDNEISYTIDVKTVSEANIREHWAKSHKRHKEQKLVTEMTTRSVLAGLPKEHVLKQENAMIDIKITRIAAGTMDTDNLLAACKYIRDGIADTLAPGLAAGRADGLNRFAWTYMQKKGKRKQAKIVVTLSVYEIPQETNMPYNTKYVFPRKQKGVRDD